MRRLREGLDAVLTVVFVTAAVGVLAVAAGVLVGLVEIGRRLMVGP